MNKINTALLALVLMSVGFAATANSNNKTPRQHMGNQHTPVYSVTEQTTTPNETIKKLANNTPKIEDGKRYVVKVMVMEAPRTTNMKKLPSQVTANTAISEE